MSASAPHKLLAPFLLCFLCSAPVLAQDAAGVSAAEGLCPSAFTEELCAQTVDMFKEALTDSPDSFEAFREGLSDTLKSRANDPEFMQSFLESPFLASKLDALPITLKFKLLDREEEDSVIGLEFSYSTSFKRTTLKDTGKYKHGYQFSFDLNGTVTQNEEDNPRDFINAKLSFSGNYSPSFNLNKVQIGLSPEKCDAPQFADTRECILFDAAEIERFFEPVGGAFYIDYGLNLGYETDQAFAAKNQIYGGFVYVGYEDFKRDSFMGYNSIKPSLRLAVDTVEPSSETPRALAGDESSYQRLSGDFSLVVPLQRLLGVLYYFNFNYRIFQELDASEISKSADLDAFQLRTYSLTTPTGLFLSYSSGRLPFGIKDENTVELGFNTYF
jgi:hypothetical protein